MDSIAKNFSEKEAKKLIIKLIDNDSNDDDVNKIINVEKFWLVELDKCYLSIKDSETLNRIFELKNDKTEPSISLYNNCIRKNIISNLLEKNWRRLYNNDIVNKYYIYIKNKTIL